jgi:hypothetical protein
MLLRQVPVGQNMDINGDGVLDAADILRGLSNGR